MKEVVAVVQGVEVESMDLKELGAHVKALCHNASVAAWKVGQVLTVARNRVPDKDWKKWLQKNCPGRSYQTLMRWMLLYRRNPSGEDITDRNITASYAKVGIKTTNNRRVERAAALEGLEGLACKLMDMHQENPALEEVTRELTRYLEILKPGGTAN